MAKGEIHQHVTNTIFAAVTLTSNSYAKPLKQPIYNTRRTLMSQAIQIDTLAFSKKLKAAGADERLADAIVEGITAADTSELATKDDLAEVQNVLRGEIQDVRGEIQVVRDEIKHVETVLRSEIQDVRTDLKWIKGFGAILVALLVVPILADGAESILSFYSR